MASNRLTKERTGGGYIPLPTYVVPLPERSVFGEGKKRTNVVYLRLNDEDKWMVEEAARLLGLTLQEMTRGAVVGFAKEVVGDHTNLVSEEE